MKRLFPTFLFLLLAAGLVTASDQAVRRYAFFLGANDGGAERVRLRYAESDTRSLADVMKEVGGLQDSDEVLLLDPEMERISDVFAEMKARIAYAKETSRRVEFLFYYSGHSNEKGLLLGENVYSYRQLKDNVEALEADVVMVILDSCSSGTFTRMKGGIHQPSFLIDDSLNMSGHAYLTSSSENEAAQESDRIGASFFTHYLVAGLRGAADHTGDGRVTLNEAYHYAFSETLAQTEGTRAGPQHPSYDISLNGEGDLVLTDLNVCRTKLVLGNHVAGRLFIRSLDSPDQPLVAEMNKNQGKPLTLALQEGRYRVSMVEQGNRYVKDVALTSDGPVQVNWADFDENSLESAVSRGDAASLDAEGDRSSSPFSVVHFSLGPEILLPQSGETVTVFSLSPFATRVKRVSFLQASGIAAIHHDDLPGFQATGVFGYAGGVSGFQLSGCVNYSSDSVRGFQSAGLVNICEDLAGFQISGNVNIATGSVEGIQLSGIYNQSADMTGVQIGVVNVAQDVNGLQVGLVNVARDRSGLALGLVNVQRNGLLHTQTWYDGQWGFTSLQSGTQNFYTIAYAGADVQTAQTGLAPDFATGLGLGFHQQLGPLFSDLDISGCQYYSPSELSEAASEDAAYNPPVYLVVRGQLGAGLKRFSLIGGFMSHFIFQGQPLLENRSWNYHWKAPEAAGLNAVSTSLYAGVRF